MGSVFCQGASGGEDKEKVFFEHVATPLEPIVPETSARKAPPTAVNTVGTVTVKTNDRGMAEAVVFTSDDGTVYTVKLQGQGRVLITAHGRRAELKGKAFSRSGEQVLTVQAVKLLP